MEITSSILQLRKQLHEAAEPSMKEQAARQILMEFLRAHTGLKIIDRGLWFYAAYETDSDKPPIALRADFDAVLCQDGRARHLCGHDGHSAALAALAQDLEKLSPGRSVYLIFQPGEETGEGAKLCRELIEEKGIREIYGFHNIPGYKEGAILLRRETFACASTGMEITLQGAPSHAAYPEQGRNPAMILSELIRYANELTEKPHKGVLLSTVIGADLGSSSYGVSAEKAVLRFTLRGEVQEEYDALVQGIQEYARRLSEQQNIQCSIRLREEFPATVNDPACVKKIQTAAEQEQLSFLYPEEPFRWSEDFGWYLQKTEGAMFGIGAGEEHPGLHTADYEFNDAVLETALRMYRRLLEL